MKKSAVFFVALALLLGACQPKGADQSSEQSQSHNRDSAQPADDGASVDLSAEEAEYKAWAQSEIDALVVGVEEFAALLEQGKVDEAKRMYPLVRLHFERVEPVAELFEDLDPRIDNREADLEAGEAWTGFHPIEKILWTQNTTQGTQDLARRLVADTKELQAKIAAAQVDAKLMIEGSVDLLNEVSTSKITGEEEIFSKTDLYAFLANVEGAQKIFEILTPKLNAKDPALVATIQARFADVYRLLETHKEGDAYKPYDALSADETKALAESIHKLGEPLAQMGVLLQPS